MLGWTVSNHFAVQDAESTGIELIEYEQLTQDPDEVRRRVTRATGLAFDVDGVRRLTPSADDPYEQDEILRTVNDLDVAHEYQRLLELIKANRQDAA